MSAERVTWWVWAHCPIQFKDEQAARECAQRLNVAPSVCVRSRTDADGRIIIIRSKGA